MNATPIALLLALPASHSWQPEGKRAYRYQAALDCKALAEEGQVLATATRGEEAIGWEFRGWSQPAVDATHGRGKP